MAVEGHLLLYFCSVQCWIEGGLAPKEDILKNAIHAHRRSFAVRGFLPPRGGGASPKVLLQPSLTPQSRRLRCTAQRRTFECEVMIQKWNTASSLHTLAATCTDHLAYIIRNSRSAGGLRFGLLPVATCGLVASRDVFLQMSQL